MFIYLVMAIYAILNLGFRTRMSAMMIAALAPTGALWAAIALWTGSLWGKPTWGTYWAWDARMTSTLILLTCRNVLSTARSLNPLLFQKKTKTNSQP